MLISNDIIAVMANGRHAGVVLHFKICSVSVSHINVGTYYL